MIPIIDPDNIILHIRSELIAQSELQPKRVANSLSTYGETLDKLLTKNVMDSYEKEDSFIIFRVEPRINDSDLSFTEKDNNIIYIKSYTVRVIIYGDSSEILANKLVARFRTEEVKNNLISKGIYIEEITEPEDVDEFKNGVLWLRNDFDILITSELLIPKISVTNEFESLTEFKVIQK